MNALKIAATGMLAQQLNVDVISNNIANMRTTGYKRTRAEFQDLLYNDIKRAGASSSEAGTIVPSGLQLGYGVKTGATSRIMSQGGLSNTDKELDVAIRGEGFFVVDLPSGQTAYSRDGSFELNAEGTLVTLDGFQIQPGITLPAGSRDISISRSGEVEATTGTNTTPTVVGQIQLSRFLNKGGLQSIGDNLYLETAASGTAQLGSPDADGMGSLLQKFLESANVNAVSEITDLISAQRAYEMNAKVISGADEMMSTAANVSR